MKAIQVTAFGEPDVLQMQDLPEPKAGANQVVINVKAAGVNPVDTYIRAGRYTNYALPWLPGFDAAGVVESVGEGVSHCRPGDRVYVFSTRGTYAQKILVDAPRVYPLPPEITFGQGASVGVPGATAWRALFQLAGAKPGQTVLIHGATGGVGTAAIELARAAGLTVIGTGGTDSGRDFIARIGCHHVLDHGSEGYADELAKITGGKGVDVILEMLANVNLERDLQMLAMRGTVVVIGSRGRIEIDPRLTMAKDAVVRGMLLFNASDEELKQAHAALYAAMERGNYRPVVARELDLKDAGLAHEQVMEQHAPGSFVLIPPS